MTNSRSAPRKMRASRISLLERLTLEKQRFEMFRDALIPQANDLTSPLHHKAGEETRSSLGLCDPSVIFVSIDFEFEGDNSKGERSTKTIREVGICSFDSRGLEDPSTAPHLKLSTQNHLCQQGSNAKNGHPPKKFLFGQSKLIHGEKEIRTVIEQAIVRHDSAGRPRRVVLIGQGLAGAELPSMSKIGLNIEDKAQYPSIVDIIDSWSLAKKIIPRAELAHGRITLKGILDTFGIPHKNLHSAGNDANFTMKAFLVLIAENMRRKFPESTQWPTLATIESIVLAPLDREYIKRAEQKYEQAAFLSWLRTAPTDVNGPLNCEVPDTSRSRSETLRIPNWRLRSHELDLTSLPNVLSGHDSHKLLQTLLFPNNDSSFTHSGQSDPSMDISADLLVAFHLSFGGHGSRCGSFQLHGREFSQIETAGFSTFDTNYLKDLLTNDCDAISTENLTVHANRSGGTFRFLFGESAPLTQKSLIEAFRSHISRHGPSRRVVLIGYNIKHSLCALRNSGYDFLNEFPSSIPIIDVRAVKSAKQIHLNPVAATTICALMEALDLEVIPAKYQFTSGNFTHFLLKCLLTLAVRDFHDGHADDDLTAFQTSRIQALESVARASAKDKMSTFTPDRLAFQRRQDESQALKEMRKEVKKAYRLVRPNNDWEDNLGGGLDAEQEGESSHDTGMLVDLFE